MAPVLGIEERVVEVGGVLRVVLELSAVVHEVVLETHVDLLVHVEHDDSLGQTVTLGQDSQVLFSGDCLVEEHEGTVV